MNFSIYDLILFLGISQGIFLGITILVLLHKNKTANYILSILLFITSIMLIGRVCFFKYTTVWFFRLAQFVDSFIFIFGPLLYLYVRKLIIRDKKEFQLAFYHFLPVIIHLIYFVYNLSFSDEELISLMRNKVFIVINFSIETLGLLLNAFYLYKSYTIFKRFKSQEKNNISYSQSVKKYLNVLLFGVFLFISLWFFSYVNTVFKHNLIPLVNYNSVWIGICVFIYIIGFFSLKQPEVFRMPPLEKVIFKKERLGKIELNRLKQELEILMVNEKIYLDNMLTLVQLSQKLNTSTNNTSWLLNNVHKSNFYDYINNYRVQAFIDKIHNGEHKQHTILALSLDVGFNSKSTFNKVFKEITNQTPSAFIKNSSIPI